VVVVVVVDIMTPRRNVKKHMLNHGRC